MTEAGSNTSRQKQILARMQSPGHFLFKRDGKSRDDAECADERCRTWIPIVEGSEVDPYDAIGKPLGQFRRDGERQSGLVHTVGTGWRQEGN